MSPGILYVIATPIGNLEDISYRAIRILNEVDIIAAEDTRHSRKLLQHYHLKKTLISLHEHNEQQRIPELIQRLREGKNIGLISDAGTPLVSDPGFHLVVAAHREKIQVSPIPGPCAAIVALSVAGLSADQFIFIGFLPTKSNQRRERLQELYSDFRTLIFYEAPHRILALIEDMILIFGDQRHAVIAKELTKTFETIYGGSLTELKQWLEADVNRTRGEFVVLVQGAEQNVSVNKIAIDSNKILEILLKELPVKQATALTAKITGEKKNLLYQRALKTRD